MTTSLDVGVIIAVYNGSSVKPYRLWAGTDAENSPYIIRPHDHAASTNEKIWELMGVWDENFVGTASNWSMVGVST